MINSSSDRNIPAKSGNHENQEITSGLGPFHSLQRGFQRFFDDFFLSAGHRRSLPWSLNPSIEVDESEDRYMIQVDVPGVAKKDLHLEISDNNLVVSGERKDEHEEKNGDRRFTERSYGSFYRSFPLPSNAMPDQIKADYKNGVLRISLMKTTEGVAPKNIPINDRSSETSKSPADNRSQKPERAA